MNKFKIQLTKQLSENIFKKEGILVPPEEIEKLIIPNYNPNKDYDLSIHSVALLNLIRKYYIETAP